MEEKVKVRYSDAELMEFKELIEKKLENAKMEFEFINSQITDLNGNNSDRDGGDLMDDSNKQTELEMLNNMVFRQKQFIMNLENALLRIRNKSYGICSVTGQLIDKKRLMLVPHATKSIEGKNGTNSARSATLNKREPANRSKPKVITKVIRKTPTDQKKQGALTDDWKEDGFDDFDEIDVNLSENNQGDIADLNED